MDNELAEAIEPLFNSMPTPRGSDPDRMLSGYLTALRGYPAGAVSRAVEKFLRGEYDDYSKKFCPQPPELAEMVRKESVQRTHKTGRQLYSFKAPKSAILERKIQKGPAFQKCDDGVHPPGCIWIPGPFGDDAKFGTLYGPDPDWQPPKPLQL